MVLELIWTGAYIPSQVDTDPLLQKQNCFNVISLWILSAPGKAKYHTGIIFCRYTYTGINIDSFIFSLKILLCSICSWFGKGRSKVASYSDFTVLFYAFLCVRVSFLVGKSLATS